MQSKFFEAVQDAPQHQQQKPPVTGGLKQQRRGRGLAEPKAVYRRDAGNGGGKRAKVLHGGAADAKRHEADERDAVSGTGTGNGKRMQMQPNLI